HRAWLRGPHGRHAGGDPRRDRAAGHPGGRQRRRAAAPRLRPEAEPEPGPADRRGPGPRRPRRPLHPRQQPPPPRPPDVSTVAGRWDLAVSLGEEGLATPFDATLKDLVERYPADWPAQLGLSASGPVDLIDADLSTITTQADKLIRVNDPEPWLLHLELQAS